MNTFDATMTIPIARAYLGVDAIGFSFSQVLVDGVPFGVIPVYKKVSNNIPEKSVYIGIIRITAELVQKILGDELRMANVAQPIPGSLNIFRQEILRLISGDANVSNKLFNNPEIEAEVEKQFKNLYDRWISYQKNSDNIENLI